MATGHLPDVTMVMPVHHKGRLVGFSGTIAHLPDIGGSLWASDCRELFEEGLRIQPVKLYDAGRPNQTVFDFITGNVRVPDQVLGDIEAQVTANSVGGRRLCEFLDDTRIDDLVGLSQALQERAERAMRQAITEVPDGVYRSTVRADGFDEDETRIECAVTVRGSELHVDYKGTSKQIDRGLNSVMNYTYAYTVYPIKCALDPLTPRNEGSYRSVSVSAPLGSILNPRYPAPCGARQLTGHLLAGVVYRALSQAIPDRVIAECGSAPTLRAVFSGFDRHHNRFSQVFFAAGGMGASATGMGTPASLSRPIRAPAASRRSRRFHRSSSGAKSSCRTPAASGSIAAVSGRSSRSKSPPQTGCVSRCSPIARNIQRWVCSAAALERRSAFLWPTAVHLIPNRAPL